MRGFVLCLFVSFVSLAMASEKRRIFFALLDDPNAFIVDQQPYTNYIDLKRSLLATVFNKPIDSAYIASLIWRNPQKSAVTATEHFLRFFERWEFIGSEATVVHPMASVLLPFENETLVGPNYKWMRLRFDNKTTELSMPQFMVSTTLNDTISKKMLHVHLRLSESRLEIKPPARVKYTNKYSEQAVSEVLSFSSHSKLPHSHVGIKLSFSRLAADWFSGFFTSGSATTAPEDVSTLLPPTNSETGPLLLLERLCIRHAEAVTREYYIAFRPQSPNSFGFDLKFQNNSMFVFNNFEIRHGEMSAEGFQQIAMQLAFPSMTIFNITHPLISMPTLETPPYNVTLSFPSINDTIVDAQVTPLQDLPVRHLHINRSKFGTIECSFQKLSYPGFVVSYNRQTGDINRLESNNGAFLGGNCRFALNSTKSPISGQIKGFNIDEFPHIILTNNQLTGLSSSALKIRFSWMQLKEPVTKFGVNVTISADKVWTISSSRTNPVKLPVSVTTILEKIAYLKVDMPIERLAISWMDRQMFTLKNIKLNADLSQVAQALLSMNSGMSGLTNLASKVFHRRASLAAEPSWSIPSLELAATVEADIMPFHANVAVTTFAASAENGVEELAGYVNLTYQYIQDMATTQFNKMAPALIKRFPASLTADYVNIQLVLDKAVVVGTSGPGDRILVLKCHGSVVANKKERLGFITKLFGGSKAATVKPALLAYFNTAVHFEPKIYRGTSLVQSEFVMRVFTYETIVEPNITPLKDLDFIWRNYERSVTFSNPLHKLIIDKGNDFNEFAKLLSLLKFDTIRFHVIDSSGVVRVIFRLLP